MLGVCGLGGFEISEARVSGWGLCCGCPRDAMVAGSCLFKTLLAALREKPYETSLGIYCKCDRNGSL